MIIGNFDTHAIITFKQLQCHSVNVSMHCSCFFDLQAFFLSAVRDKGPFLESEANQLDNEDWMLSRYCRFAGSYVKSRIPIMNQGSFVSGKNIQVSDGAVYSQ